MECCVEVDEYIVYVVDDWDVCCLDFGDFGWVDVDVYDFCVWCEECGFVGYLIVEVSIEGD